MSCRLSAPGQAGVSKDNTTVLVRATSLYWAGQVLSRHTILFLNSTFYHAVLSRPLKAHPKSITSKGGQCRRHTSGTRARYVQNLYTVAIGQRDGLQKAR